MEGKTLSESGTFFCGGVICVLNLKFFGAFAAFFFLNTTHSPDHEFLNMEFYGAFAIILWLF